MSPPSPFVAVPVPIDIDPDAPDDEADADDGQRDAQPELVSDQWRRDVQRVHRRQMDVRRLHGA